MSDQNECVVAIEELCPMRSDGRVGSASDDDRCTEVDNILGDEADDMDTRVRELKKLVEAEKQHTKTADPNQSARPPKTPKVPFILRDRKDFLKYYVPRVVSIGPIHHDELNLFPAEKYKPKLAAAFIKESGQETEALYNIINERIKKLKDYYDEDVLKDCDDKTLSWILFLDGCWMLMFICSFIHGRLEHFQIKTDHIAFTLHDLFLLENQIPFKVLRLLMNATPCSFTKKLKESIERFIHANVMAPLECKTNLSFDMDKLNPIHHLDLLQKVLQLEGPVISHNKKKIKIRTGELQAPQSFRNIQELKVAGINLKQSKSCSLKDITFGSFWFTGLLQLPPLIVDYSTSLHF